MKKYKAMTFVVLLTALIGCSAPRSHHNYRGSGMREHQSNKKVDHQVRTKEDWARRRSGKRGDE
jgi:hypothetical protein